MQHLSPLIRLIAISMAAHVALTGTRVTTALNALSLQASELAVGLLVALFAIFPMLFAVRLGRLVDRIGIKKPMTCGCIAISVGSLLPALFAGLAALYLAVILIGTGFMTIHIGSQHAVGAMSHDADRSSNFSLLALGFSASSFLGPVLAGFVIDHVSFTAAYAMCSGFALLALLQVWRGKLERMPLQRHDVVHAGGTLELLRDREMRGIYAIGVLLAAAWDLFTFVTPIHGTRLGFSASTIGLILGAFSAATFTVRLAMPRIARRYTEWQVLTGALALVVLCYLLFPFVRQAAALMALAAGLGLALGSSQPNVLALLHRAAPPGRGAEAIGIRATIGNASQVILPISFGAAGVALGPFAVFWGLAAVISAGIPVAWRRAARNRP